MIFSFFTKAIAREISRWLLVNHDHSGAQLSAIRQDIVTMSQSLGQRLDVVAAALRNDLVRLNGDLARIAEAIAALQMKPGDTVTEEQVATIEASVTGLEAGITSLTPVADALDAMAKPAPPAVPPGAPVVT